LATNGTEHPFVGTAVCLFQDGKYTEEGTLCGLAYRERTLWVIRCGINQWYDWFKETRSVVQAAEQPGTTHDKDKS
jgi:hypothetical protein